MAIQNAHHRRTLDLTRKEQWVLHDVMLDRIELELHAPTDTDPPSLAVYRIFEKLEAGMHRFSERERRCIQRELRQHAAARDTPARDTPIAERILEDLP